MTSYLFERVDGPLLLPNSYSKIFYEIAEYLNEAELGVDEDGRVTIRRWSFFEVKSKVPVRKCVLKTNRAWFLSAYSMFAKVGSLYWIAVRNTIL